MKRLALILCMISTSVWAVNSGVVSPTAPALPFTLDGSGNLTLGTGTTLNGYSYLTSQPTFPSSTPGWIRFANNIALPYPVVASTYMAWGGGTINGTPASTGCPASTNTFANGAVFEVDTDSKMYAAVYQGNTRTAVQDLSVATGNKFQPVDNLTHNYEVWYRPTKIYWYIDSALVATSSYGQSALAVDTIPSVYLVVQGATTTATLSSNAVSVSDSAKNNVQISDGKFPWRKTTVTAASTAAATTDLGQVVSISPNGGNPCQNPTAILQSIAGTTSGTASVQLIALSGTTKIYVCSATIVSAVSTTLPTFRLTYGTGSACDTGTGSIIPAFATATTAGTLYQFATPVGVTPAGNALCYIDGGTLPVQNYSISYVHQ